MDYNAYFTGALARLRSERRYRVFADLERIAGRWSLPGGGVLVVEATKQLYKPISLRRTVRRAVPQLAPALEPVGAA